MSLPILNTYNKWITAESTNRTESIASKLVLPPSNIPFSAITEGVYSLFENGMTGEQLAELCLKDENELNDSAVLTIHQYVSSQETQPSSFLERIMSILKAIIAYIAGGDSLDGKK